MKILTSFLVQLCFTHCISQFNGTFYDSEEPGELGDLDYEDTLYTNQQEDEYGKAKRGLRRRKNACEGKEEGPPRFTDTNQLKFLSAKNQGSRHVLYCPYHGCPQPNMTWVKDGDEIVRKRAGGYGKSEISINRRKYRIIINNNRKEDDGNYTCVISNEFGSINHTIEVKSIEVRYRQKPRIKEELTNQTVLVGSNVTFNCEPDIEDNTDAINIHWYRNYMKNGSFINEQGLVYSTPLKTIERTRLELTNLQVNDSTFYTCQLENTYGATLSSAYIEVVETLEPPEDSMSLVLYIGVAASVSVVICGLFFLLCLYYRHQSRQSIKDKQEAIDNAITVAAWVKQVIVTKQFGGADDLLNPIISIEKVRIESNDDTAHPSEFEFPVDTVWEFPRDELQILDVLGEGAFGKVMMGQAKAAIENGRLDRSKFDPQSCETTTVAVKMVKEGHTDHDIIDLVKEMEIMKAIGRHPNIINLLGVCAQPAGYPLLVIVEYARYGNLRDFLKLRKPKTQDYLKEQRKLGYPPQDRQQVIPPIIQEDIEEETKPVSLKQMLSFALQVAKGMDFLSSRKCVHRDLAARNVLVADNLVLKIADFGLARDVKDTEYYRKESEGRLPIKWMAPESLFERVSSTMSDVWSFGILFWEIVTFGDIPYREEYLPNVFIELIRNGYKMKRPLGCPENVYNVMYKCWGYQAVDRPCWTELVSVLYTLHSEADPDEYLDLNVPDLDTPPSSPEPFTRVRKRSDRLALTTSLYVLPNEATTKPVNQHTGAERTPLLEEVPPHKYIQLLPDSESCDEDDVFSSIQDQGMPNNLFCYELAEREARLPPAKFKTGGKLSQIGQTESIYPSPVSLQHPSSLSLAPEGGGGGYPVMYTALRSPKDSPYYEEDIQTRHQFTTFKPDKKRGSSESGYGTNRDSESSDSRYRVTGIDKIRHASESDSVFLRMTPSPTSD